MAMCTFPFSTPCAAAAPHTFGRYDNCVGGASRGCVFGVKYAVQGPTAATYGCGTTHGPRPSQRLLKPFLPQILPSFPAYSQVAHVLCEIAAVLRRCGATAAWKLPGKRPCHVPLCPKLTRAFRPACFDAFPVPAPHCRRHHCAVPLIYVPMVLVTPPGHPHTAPHGPGHFSYFLPARTRPRRTLPLGRRRVHLLRRDIFDDPDIPPFYVCVCVCVCACMQPLAS